MTNQANKNINEFASFRILQYFKSHRGALFYQLFLLIGLAAILYYQSGLFMTIFSLSFIISIAAHYAFIADAELVVRDGKKISGPVFVNVLIVISINSFMAYHQLWAVILIAWSIPVIFIVVNFFLHIKK